MFIMHVNILLICYVTIYKVQSPDTCIPTPLLKPGVYEEGTSTGKDSPRLLFPKLNSR